LESLWNGIFESTLGSNSRGLEMKEADQMRAKTNNGNRIGSISAASPREWKLLADYHIHYGSGKDIGGRVLLKGQIQS